MWFLSRFYTADEADRMGLVNTVVPVSAGKLIENEPSWLCLGTDKYMYCTRSLLNWSEKL
jgi:1,4-dihydroxy-2-naphthoyl-CoA synthase